jgi:hypothetical protein
MSRNIWHDLPVAEGASFVRADVAQMNRLGDVLSEYIGPYEGALTPHELYDVAVELCARAKIDKDEREAAEEKRAREYAEHEAARPALEAASRKRMRQELAEWKKKHDPKK